MQSKITSKDARNMGVRVLTLLALITLYSVAYGLNATEEEVCQDLSYSVVKLEATTIKTHLVVVTPKVTVVNNRENDGFIVHYKDGQDLKTITVKANRVRLAADTDTNQLTKHSCSKTHKFKYNLLGYNLTWKEFTTSKSYVNNVTADETLVTK